MSRENDLPQEESCHQPPPPYTEHTDVQVPRLSGDNNRQYDNVATSGFTIGTIPCPKAPERGWKYLIDSRHYPPGYQSDDTFENAPWVAETTLAFDDPTVARSTLAQWRDNPDTCFRDTITVMGEPSTDRSLFVRTIQWQQCNSDDASNRFVEYSLSVLIYSKNSKWLASLPRASIGYGNFISLESAVRVDGVAFSGEDLLADGHHFYLKFLKPWRMLLAYERGRGSVSVVGIDLPEMRNIVDETLVSRLRCPGDV